MSAERWEIGDERFWLTCPKSGEREFVGTETANARQRRGEPAEYLVPIDSDDGDSVALVYQDHYAEWIAKVPEMLALLRKLAARKTDRGTITDHLVEDVQEARTLLDTFDLQRCGLDPTHPLHGGPCAAYRKVSR